MLRANLRLDFYEAEESAHIFSSDSILAISILFALAFGLNLPGLDI